MFARVGEVDVVVGDEPVRIQEARPHRSPAHREERPLSIVQITDPHLGPFMSVQRLQRICQRAVERNPDLIVLTGDFLTMESQHDPKHLRDALAPLRAAPGKVFACLGNHDHEALDIVRDALSDNGVTLLVDDSTTVTTDAGLVQIVGLDFHFRERAARVPAVFEEHPRVDDALRLVLLHDPGAFRHVPEGEADLVLSGHTHGGQVGLVSLGAAWTFLRLFGTKMPDHGLWARGRDRLYVHRGTGHYGFPLRLGVPSEESVLRVHRVR
jgi:predicted MPP superfamily phosphohydrolase